MPRLVSMQGLLRRVRILAVRRRRGDQLGDTVSSSNQHQRAPARLPWPPRVRPAAGCARSGCGSARQPLLRGPSTVHHASFPPGVHPAGVAFTIGCTVVHPGWVKDSPGQCSQAIGARGSGCRSSTDPSGWRRPGAGQARRGRLGGGRHDRPPPRPGLMPASAACRQAPRGGLCGRLLQPALTSHGSATISSVSARSRSALQPLVTPGVVEGRDIPLVW
jgi:hypothetical protein